MVNGSISQYVQEMHQPSYEVEEKEEGFTMARQLVVAQPPLRPVQCSSHGGYVSGKMIAKSCTQDIVLKAYMYKNRTPILTPL